MSTKNLTPVLKTSFVLLAILVLLGIVMPDGYQVWSEQLREVISRQSFYFVAFSWLVPLGKSNWGNPIRCLNTLLSLGLP